MEGVEGAAGDGDQGNESGEGMSGGEQGDGEEAGDSGAEDRLSFQSSQWPWPWQCQCQCHVCRSLPGLMPPLACASTFPCIHMFVPYITAASSGGQNCRSPTAVSDEPTVVGQSPMQVFGRPGPRDVGRRVLLSVSHALVLALQEAPASQELVKRSAAGTPQTMDHGYLPSLKSTPEVCLSAAVVTRWGPVRGRELPPAARRRPP